MIVEAEETRECLFNWYVERGTINIVLRVGMFVRRGKRRLGSRMLFTAFAKNGNQCERELRVKANKEIS